MNKKTIPVDLGMDLVNRWELNKNYFKYVNQKTKPVDGNVNV